MGLKQVLAHIDATVDGYITDLAEFVRIPSISAGAEAATAAIHRAAGHLVTEFEALGLHAKAIRISGDSPPLVLAHPHRPLPGRPHVLIYGHYDVQGVDNPRSAWSFDPFAAECRDGYLLGRGASDNKGQLLTHAKALAAVVNTGHELPINPVFLIEGEEECGSAAIGQFIRAGGLDDLGPFLCTVVSDSGMYGPEQPSLTMGLRGIVFTEVTLTGPRQDLHSGVYGGVVANPNNVLVRALAGLTDAKGRVMLPEFYTDILPLDERERANFADLPNDEDALRGSAGVQQLLHEDGFSVLEQRWVRPTWDINFLAGGSPRTVIPASARAAVSCRLVPGQDPQTILAALQSRLQAELPSGYTMEFNHAQACSAYHLSLDDPLVVPTLEAIRTGFQIEPVLTREGGSIPIVLDLAAATAAPVLLLGFGQVTDNWHGPDERFSLRDFHRGIRTAAALMFALGRYRT